MVDVLHVDGHARDKYYVLSPALEPSLVLKGEDDTVGSVDQDASRWLKSRRQMQCTRIWVVLGQVLRFQNKWVMSCHAWQFITMFGVSKLCTALCIFRYKHWILLADRSSHPVGSDMTNIALLRPLVAGYSDIGTRTSIL